MQESSVWSVDLIDQNLRHDKNPVLNESPGCKLFLSSVTSTRFTFALEASHNITTRQFHYRMYGFLSLLTLCW